MRTMKLVVRLKQLKTMGNLKENLKSIADDCRVLQQTADGCGAAFKTCVIDLSQKIAIDNFGTTSGKDTALNALVDTSDILSDISELADNILTVLNN
jgi:hypothetical protein